MKLWQIALASWLVLNGLMSVANLSFRYDDLVMGVLAILAGALIVIRK